MAAVIMAGRTYATPVVKLSARSLEPALGTVSVSPVPRGMLLKSN